MMQQILDSATSLFLPYFIPVIFILLAVIVADRLRETMTKALLVKEPGRRSS